MSHLSSSYKRRRLEQSIPLSQSNKALLSREQTQTFRYTSTFWDNLSQIYLTSRSLEEHNRRTTSRISVLNLPQGSYQQKSILLIPVVEYLHQSSSKTIKRIQLSARHGGPDLSDLRNFSSVAYRAMKTRSTLYNPNSTTQTPNNTLQTKSTGPYDRNFQQHLVDNAIYPLRYRYLDGRMPEKPNNWTEIIQRLGRRRKSLSFSRFTAEDYERFLQADTDAAKEKQVTTSVIPIITGNIADEKCVSGGIPFNNLDPLTDGTLKSANPDIYYGARTEQLSWQIRNKLHRLIIPSTQDDLPICPNFFLEVKGQNGTPAVASRQVIYDGAIWTRTMHTLQSYPEKNAPPNNNAYTITTIYHGGTLTLYASYYRQPRHAGQPPKCYIHQLNGWSMTGNIDTFRQGAAAFRNARDWAKEQRDKAIEQANRKIGVETSKEEV